MLVGALIKIVVYAYVLWAVVHVYRKHSKKAHRRAVKKFSVIWFISTLPIFIAALLSKPDTTNAAHDFLSKIYEFFPIQEQFVYASAFLAPVLYVFVDASLEAMSTDGKTFTQELKDQIRGYSVILFPAFLLLILTCVSFAANKEDSANFQKTYLYALFGSQAWFVYLATLALWYASILLEFISLPSLPDEQRKEEEDFSSKAQARFAGE
jgi:hypothetical protein